MVQLRRAQNKNVALRSGCVGTGLMTDQLGQVTKVEYKKWTDPIAPDTVVSAPAVLVAADAIETPELLVMWHLAN